MAEVSVLTEWRSWVMHGGGMRGGAYCAGVIEALRRLVGADGIRLVIGTSAGAANAAALAAGAIEALRNIWTQALHRSDFTPHFDSPVQLYHTVITTLHEFNRLPRWIQSAGLIRITRWRYMTDIDFLMDTCARAGIYNNAVRNSATKLFVAVTHYLSGTARFFTNADDVMEAVRASVSIPILSRTPVIVHGEPYLDGGISASTSDLIAKAFREGADRVVAVDLSSRLNALQRLGLRWYARSKTKELRTAIARMTAAPHPEPLLHDERVYLIRPAETMVTRLRYSAGKLSAAYERGVRETLEDEKLKEFLGL